MGKCVKCDAKFEADKDDHYAFLHCPEGLESRGDKYKVYCAECGKKIWNEAKKKESEK